MLGAVTTCIHEFANPNFKFLVITEMSFIFTFVILSKQYLSAKKVCGLRIWNSGMRIEHLVSRFLEHFILWTSQVLSIS